MINVKRTGYLFGCFLLLLIAYWFLSFRAEPIGEHPYFNPNGFLVIAHRGGLGLGPESTLYTFQRAIEVGADILEMDLQGTKDDHLVIFHDRTVEHTTNGFGSVQDFTLAELKKLDAGYHWTPDSGRTFPFRGKGLVIPTLDEVFSTFPDTRLNIELKDTTSNMVGPLCRMIREHKRFDNVLVVAFDKDSLKQFRSICPKVATSAAAAEVWGFYAMQLARLESIYSPPAQALQVPVNFGSINVVTRRFVNAAHARHMRVHVWTVNDTESMEHLRKLGVDGIMTDYPKRLLKVLGRSRE